ncbi:cytochrome P450 [Hymenopellis radicata]|nr:cytochrome P450 [Hymenopellis radicata]
MALVLVLVLVSLLSAFCIVGPRLIHQKNSSENPPLVEIPDWQIFYNSRHAYEAAIKQHGSIVGVRRKNRLEYIVDHTLVAEVLANDSVFSFERGTLSVLNLRLLLALPRSFMQEIDRVVQDHIAARLGDSVAEVAPVFEKLAGKLTASLKQGSRPVGVELNAEVHRIMAEAMLTLILGEKYTSSKDISSTVHIAASIATLTGIYENLSWWSRKFPTASRIMIWLKVMLIAIPYHFVRGIGWRAFKELGTVTEPSLSPKNRRISMDPVLVNFSRKFVNKDTHRISILDRIWILSVLLGLIFASVHQTAVVIVWVLFELAKRPEFIEDIRAEVVLETGDDGTHGLTYASLRNSERLDSFIREVMRTKGDTLSTVRETVVDAPLGGYVIPKGSLVIPLATLANESEEYHGENAKDFIGDRWVGTGKPAIMLSPSYFPFGLGRWACPGRGLAVAEIKLLVLSIITRANISLEGNSYDIVDPLNVTSVAPQGKFLLHSMK